MAQDDHDHVGTHGTAGSRAIHHSPSNATPAVSAEEDMLADVDDPPDLDRTPRPSGLRLHDSFKASFSKATLARSERKESLLTTALNSNSISPIDENPGRGMSTWSNHSASTAELTSDGGLTSPDTRTNSPSPPPPSSMFHRMVPVFNNKPFDQPLSIANHEDENIGPLQTAPPAPTTGEHGVEANLGRKRCITFACGRKDTPKPVPESVNPAPSPQPNETKEPPKRVCTIKFACPTKVSADAPSKINKPRQGRAASPAPLAQHLRSSPKLPLKAHRDSDSTVRNPSPVSVRKQPAVDRSRRLSTNSDLARCEAFRFHEFASSEEEVEEWTQESTCHQSRLTIKDTLKIENSLRQLGEEAEEEALDDEEDELEEDEDDDANQDDADEDGDGSDADVSSDEGFQTDNEEGFADSDDESDAGSDCNWWTPGGRSTAATSIEHLDLLRPSALRTMSESSMGSLNSGDRIQIPHRPMKRTKSRPVNIRVPSPELPDSTDFVCGTLDEDRPLEDAYLNCLERRRAAKHKATPQDIDPTFPTSDPEMEEEDEDDESEHVASESDQHVMVHGQMDPIDSELRGRRTTVTTKRSPMQSPRRLRSPPPKRTVLRSPPPRKTFGTSPKRVRSPAPARLRSPPPTRRRSHILLSKRADMSIQFTGLRERPVLTTSSSLPRTPILTHPPDYDDEDTCCELPIRRAIDIKIGLEKKRQRRKEQLYKKMHRKGGKPEKRPPRGKGAERMREMGLGLAAKGKQTGFGFGMPPTPDQADMHVLSV
ncbi:hypothetical protein BDV95DRAFT_131961 [Massariosphaeria phaeospora]|uniref:Uncharacterized protein n=1 Tax=Massariosphaeria phaeospora TaxID=100035 RepID=A0A7C8IHR6_9PLEO|nr:hypothetical protein BDV95DRAFT_131961 [Massariosphaeria phaeospora]